MNKKSLNYTFFGFAAISLLSGLLILNRTQTPSPVLAEVSQNPTNSATPAPHGMGMMTKEQADRHFVEMMIPHHEGAIEMANLALTQAKRPEIKQLAQAIKKDQNREIEQMKAWYKQWYGTEVPATSAHGSMGMPMNPGTGTNHGGNQGMPMNPGTGTNHGGNQGMPMNSGTGTNHGGNQGMPMNSCMEMMGMHMMHMSGMMSMDLEALKNASDFDQAFIQQMIPHHKMAVMMGAMVLDSDRPEMRNLATSIIQAQSTEIQQMQEWYQAWYQ